MSKNFVSGSDVQSFIDEILDTKSKFDLIRSTDKNKMTKFQDIILTPFISNTSLGICLANKINLHLSLFSLDHSLKFFLDQNAVELLYKNEIFVLSTGLDWIFDSKIGQSLVNMVFGNFESSIWKDELNLNSLHIYLEDKITISSILPRLKSSYSYYPPKFHNETYMVNHIQFIANINEVNFINSNLPNVLVSTEITSEIINQCFKYSIPLIFIGSGIFFDELMREIHYYLSNRTKIDLFYHPAFVGNFI